MAEEGKPLVWYKGEVKSPPFSDEARLRAGFLLRKLQQGVNLEMPDSRPMPAIGKRCHELRIYFIDEDAIIILEVFAKKTKKTPKDVIDLCKRRLARYTQ